MTPAEWWVDTRDAAKCGEAGIPTAGDVPPLTDRQCEIARTADHELAMVRRRTQAQTGPMEARLANLNERIGQLQARIGELNAQVVTMLGRPVYRLPAEAGVPDEVVADRRAADNRKEAAPIRQQITALVRQRDELAAEAARIDRDIVVRWRQAGSTARAVGELARRRESRYWRLLCHRHPEGARLAALSDHPRIVLAAWVNGPTDEQSTDMSIPDNRLDRHISNGSRVIPAGPKRGAPPPVKPRYQRVEIGGFRRPVTVTLMVVLFCAGVGDFVNAKTVFDLVFTESASVYAWALAVSLTALAIIVTHAAGYLWREAQHHRGLKSLAASMLVAWLAAGGLLAALRVVIGSTTGTTTSGQAGNPLAGLQNAGNPAPHPLVVALVLAAVWLATGLVSFAIGYLAHAPADAALGRLEASTARESRRLGQARGDECQAAHTVAAQRLHKTRLREAWRQADARAEAQRDELRAWARSELVRVLGDPAATNDVLPRPASTDRE